MAGEGAVGIVGWSLIITLAEGAEAHPDDVETTYVYVPCGILEIVVLIPVPEDVTPPGERVNVHEPDEGKPFNTTRPVETVQVGWVIVPITGDGNVFGCELITRFADTTDSHPAALATLNVCVPCWIPEIITLVPAPIVTIPPGLRVSTHVPVAGNPLKSTLPVARAHVG